QVDLERGRSKKTEAVGLVNVLVWSPGNTDLGQGDVGHDGMKLLGQLVMAEQFAQPAAGVVIPGKRPPDHALDRSWSKLEQAGLLYPDSFSRRLRRAYSSTASACSSVSMEPGRSRRMRAMAVLAEAPLATK